MRFAIGMAALWALTACTVDGDPSKQADTTPGEAAAVLATAGGAFDYRYAYRLPGRDVKAVQEAHAAGCDKLGPARCRILNLRYRVDAKNHISALLTLSIDPSIARNFGEAATRTVTGQGGALVDTEIAGADTTAAARSGALVARLREQLANAQAQGPAGADRATRLRTALETIAEVEAGQGQTMATSPVLITYSSGKPAPGLTSNSASFEGAGDKLVGSLSVMADVLAGVGPWIALMAVAVFVLRFFVHGTESASTQVAEAEPEAEPRDRNLIQRWFSPDAKEDA